MDGILNKAGEALFGSGPKFPGWQGTKLTKKAFTPGTLGQGANWLGGLGYQGKGFNESGARLDVAGGGLFDYRGPELAASLLMSEFQPGGTLSDSNRSRLTAQGVNALTSSGNTQRRTFIETAVARGIAPERAAIMLRDWDQGMLEKVQSFMLEQEQVQKQKQYDALQAWVNMASETSVAAKRDLANWKLAEFGAAMSKWGGQNAGMSNLLGSAAVVAGGAMGGAGGAAAAGSGAAGPGFYPPGSF